MCQTRKYRLRFSNSDSPTTVRHSRDRPSNGVLGTTETPPEGHSTIKPKGSLPRIPAWWYAAWASVLSANIPSSQVFLNHSILNRLHASIQHRSPESLCFFLLFQSTAATKETQTTSLAHGDVGRASSHDDSAPHARGYGSGAPGARQCKPNQQCDHRYAWFPTV